MVFVSFFFECYGNHRDLHVLTHSFPTRRSSDLVAIKVAFDPLAGTVEDIGDVPEQVFEIGLDAGVDEAASHRVEDVGDGAASEPIVGKRPAIRSEEHTSELQSLMRISYAVFCLKKKNIATS